jgi:hypothetical protein
MKLITNPELRDELPPLDAVELDNLRRSIERDGILDSIKFWFNEDTQANEIVDGHHRFVIANELGIEYLTHELVFESITAVKLWQNMTQTGRRKHRALDRMVELETQLRLEREGVKPKVSEVVEAVAERANVGTATVYRAMAKAKMGYEVTGPIGDELDQSLPEENYIEGVTDNEFSQVEPDAEQRAVIAATKPQMPKRPQSLDNQRRSALKAYEIALGKIQGLRLDLLFDGLVEPDYKACHRSIEEKRALIVVKKKFGRG